MNAPKIIAAVALLALASCGSTIKGRIIAMPQGTVLPCTLARSYGSGKMTARNPTTGEVFEGLYTGFYRKAASGGGLTVNSLNNAAAGGSVTQTSVVQLQGVTVEAAEGLQPAGLTAKAQAVLSGSQGTTIRLSFEISPGVNPNGYGRGSDQKGQQYEIFF